MSVRAPLVAVTVVANSSAPILGIFRCVGPRGSMTRIKSAHKLRSVPNSRELWDARTALPRSLLTCRVRFRSRDVNSTFVLGVWH